MPTSKGAHFRAQRSQQKGQGWLKHIGKFGFPIRILLKLYQLCVVCYDLIHFSVVTYKEIWFSIFAFVLPMKRKTLIYDVSIVVGSASGVGRELALKLARCHAVVVCIDLQTPEQETTSKIIKDTGEAAFYYQCDVTDKTQVDTTIELIKNEIGNITMLFHCCSLPSPFTDSASIKQTFDVSVVSYFYLLDSILPHMKANCKGHIIFLKSVAALNGNCHQSALSAQFAVQGLYEAIVEELRVGKLDSIIKTTLVHIYPFIVNEIRPNDHRLRVPGFFGAIHADKAAAAIIDGIRKNKTEISVPKYYLFISQVLKLYPRRVTLLLRDLLDTGIEI